jgi:RNA polymerase sigma factor (TIGR02999 family)
VTAEPALTDIIQQWRNGNKLAENQLYQFAYLRLRKIAQQQRAKSANTHGVNNAVLSDSINSTTALVHDAYIKMSKSDIHDIHNQRAFYLMAAKVMRQILIDNARTQNAQKRQADATEAAVVGNNKLEELIVLDKTIDTFSVRYPRQSDALKLKYLMGLKNKEISHLLECSDSLIEKDLKFSRSWLQAQMAS